MIFYKFLRTLYLFYTITFNGVNSTHSTNDITTVDIDPTFYTGTWYQTYGDSFITSTFEKDAFCVYANYSLLNDNTIGVYNWERIGSVTGQPQNISGYAFITDNPGQLYVFLSGNFPAPYWVIKTGPVVDKEYQYSIVTDPYMLGLYVLVRNVNTFYELYNDEVIEFLDENHFTSIYNKPVQIIQENCTYE